MYDSKCCLYQLVLSISLLLVACGHTTEFEEGAFFYPTPEEVAMNLSKAYKEKNIERYLSSFSEDSKFSEQFEFLWGKAQEEKIHRKMFAALKEIALKLQELRSDEETETTKRAVYNYELEVEFPADQVLQAQGLVALDFVKNTQGHWQINTFRDLKTGLMKFGNPESGTVTNNDSVDYFPLRVGNSWIYEEQFAPGIEDVKVLITDSLMINENLYYQAGGHGYPFVVSASFARKDSLHQLRLFVEDDSTERIIFNLAAEIGDTLTFTPPNASEVMVVELISQKDSVTVPAGTFANVLEFLVTDFNSGARYLYEFTANIGLIRQKGTNQVMALKSAVVNGKKYPIITGVETRYVSWTQIKKSYIK